MKRKVTLESLANELNMSKTTVSKAIHNCPGVHPETKNKVWAAACNYGYIPPASGHKIAIITPSVPDYFWTTMRKHLNTYAEKEKIPYAIYTYSDLSQSKDALQCMDRVQLDGVSVLIIAAPDSPEIKARLEEIASSQLVILIETYLEAKNTFFVGEDGYAQGYQLGRAYLQKHPESTRFALYSITGYKTEHLRIDGFSAALQEYGKTFTTRISYTAGVKAQSAVLARQLAAMQELPHCIFCPSSALYHVTLAVKKLKTEQEIHCIGLDLNPSQPMPDAPYVLMQDIEAQAREAIACAKKFLQTETFPDRKIIYVNQKGTAPWNNP